MQNQENLISVIKNGIYDLTKNLKYKNRPEDSIRKIVNEADNTLRYIYENLKPIYEE